MDAMPKRKKKKRKKDHTTVAVLIGKLLNCLCDRSLVLNKYSINLTLKRNSKTPYDCCHSIGGEHRDILRDYNLSDVGGAYWLINLLIELADPTYSNVASILQVR